jgi:hypothetical protein
LGDPSEDTKSNLPSNNYWLSEISRQNDQSRGEIKAALGFVVIIIGFVFLFFGKQDVCVKSNASFLDIQNCHGSEKA